MKRLFFLCLCLIVALPLISCAKPISAGVLKDRVFAAVANLKTYTATGDVTQEMTIRVEGKSFDFSAAADIEMAADIPNDRTRMATSFSKTPSFGDFSGPSTFSMEDYIVDGTLYHKTSFVEGSWVWTRQEMPAGLLEQTKQLQRQMEWISLYDIEITGSEDVEGVDCYVVDVKIDADRLLQAMSGFPGLGDMFGDPPVAPSMIEDLRVKEWLDKDTFFPVKVTMHFSAAVDASELSLPVKEDGGMTMDATMTLKYPDVNQPVSIEIPAEALDAAG